MLLDVGAASVRLESAPADHAQPQVEMILGPEFPQADVILEYVASSVSKPRSEITPESLDQQLRLEYAITLPSDVRISDVPQIGIATYDAVQLWGMDVMFDCGSCVYVNPGLLAVLINERRQNKRREQVVRLSSPSDAMVEVMNRIGVGALLLDTMK